MQMTQVLQQIFWQVVAFTLTPAFWLMTIAVYLQIRRRTRQKEEMFQVDREPVIGLTIYTVLAGMMGGVIASCFLLWLGVSVEHIALQQIWILALLLMMLRQRFFCFAYAGGILACMHGLFGWPDIQVSPLLALVAVLHCTEAFLVLTTGHCNALPIYLQDRNGHMTGGFLLQMIWPLPLVMLCSMSRTVLQPQAGFFVFPDYWPIIGTLAETVGNQLYVLLPVLAALGYSDVAVNGTVLQKTRQSAVCLLAYSGCLLFLTVLTDGSGIWQLIPALFALVGHEAMIRYGKRDAEIFDAKTYRAPEQGIFVLDVQRCSPAKQAGLRRADWIIGLNGRPIENRRQFLECQLSLPEIVMVEYWRRGKKRTCCVHRHETLQLGIITAPDDQCELYWNLKENDGILKFLQKKFEKTLKNIR